MFARMQAESSKSRNGLPNKFEADCYKFLEESGIRFETQFVIGPYVADVAVLESKTVINLDGDYWHGNPDMYRELNSIQARRVEIDQRMDEFLRSEGWNVVRIWESDFRRDHNCLLKACVTN